MFWTVICMNLHYYYHHYRWSMTIEKYILKFLVTFKLWLDKVFKRIKHHKKNQISFEVHDMPLVNFFFRNSFIK